MQEMLSSSGMKFIPSGAFIYVEGDSYALFGFSSFKNCK